MPLVCVPGARAQDLAEALARLDLPELSVAIAADDSRSVERAQILFGSPDDIAPLLNRAAALRWVQSTWAGVTPLLQQGRRARSAHRAHSHTRK